MAWLGLAGAAVKDQYLWFLKETVKLEERLIAIKWTVEVEPHVYQGMSLGTS